MIAEAVTSALVAALLTTYPPVGCVIDCSTRHGRVTTYNSILLETLDGMAIKTEFEYLPGTAPGAPWVGFEPNLRCRGWDYEKSGGHRLFVRGSKAPPPRPVNR